MRRLRRRRRNRQALRLARLIVELDRSACDARHWKPDRHTRLSLGRT